MESIFEWVNAIPSLVLALTTILGLAGTAWEMWRKGKEKQAFESAQKALESVATAIALFPQSDTREKLEKQIKAVAEFTGSESERLSQTVKAVKQSIKFMEDLGLKFGKGKNAEILDKAEFLRQAGEVVEQARAARNAKQNPAPEGGK